MLGNALTRRRLQGRTMSSRAVGICRFGGKHCLRRGLFVLVCCGLLSGESSAQTHRTPRAGEAYTGSLFGRPLKISERDRRKVSAVSLGLQWIPDGPEDREAVPVGALFLWRNRREGGERVRAVLSGLYNEVRYHTSRWPLGGAEAVLAFENVTLPFARSEYVEGRRIASEELEWHSVRLGAGLGHRIPLAPGHQENALEVTLTYEPGVLLFEAGDETGRDFLVPRDAYEGRFHLSLRADALERNLLELPHQGFATGLDGSYGHRSGWRDWGGAVFGRQRAESGRNWYAWSAYAIAAGAVPFVADERHRLLFSMYGGAGAHLDRFSAFRLGGGSNAGDWEALAHAVLPGAAFEEFFTRRYGIANLEYRSEALFFLYLQLRGSLAWVERPRWTAGGSIAKRTDPMHSLTAAVSSGFLWDSSLEFAYSYNFGLRRQQNGAASSGGSALFLSWTKVF